MFMDEENYIIPQNNTVVGASHLHKGIQDHACNRAPLSMASSSWSPFR